MSHFKDLAAALHTESLTLFVGSGFSKHLTNGKAPTWKELLIECCNRIDEDKVLFNQLFNHSEDTITAKYELIQIAQILSFEYNQKSKNLKIEVSKIIKERVNDKTIDKDKIAEIKDFFSKYQKINIVTTNYDTLFSDYILPFNSKLIIDGGSISRYGSLYSIYHIHGSINDVKSIVITMDDYYQFQNNNNYFSRKFYTILQETTVAILGYNLGDFNLNGIFNEVKNTKRDSIRKSDVFQFNRSEVERILCKYYKYSFGINVIENVTIPEFFYKLSNEYDKVKKVLTNVEQLNDTLVGIKVYTDEYLKLNLSLDNILLQAGTLNIDPYNEDFLILIIDILERKVRFTTEDGAWGQYESLASWIIEILTIVDINKTIYKKEFISIIKHSLSKSSKDLYFGYSWKAWQVWNNRWNEIKDENKIVILNHYEKSHIYSKKYNSLTFISK